MGEGWGEGDIDPPHPNLLPQGRRNLMVTSQQAARVIKTKGRGHEDGRSEDLEEGCRNCMCVLSCALVGEDHVFPGDRSERS